MEVLWRSSAETNPIGVEARLIDMEGEKVLEASFGNNLPFHKRLKAVKRMLSGRRVTFSTIYIGNTAHLVGVE